MAVVGSKRLAGAVLMVACTVPLSACWGGPSFPDSAQPRASAISDAVCGAGNWVSVDRTSRGLGGPTRPSLVVACTSRPSGSLSDLADAVGRLPGMGAVTQNDATGGYGLDDTTTGMSVLVVGTPTGILADVPQVQGKAGPWIAILGSGHDLG